ncbi:sporulation kinase [Paenibacillus sp. J31TS4]|uniref:sensor histidine kinase n=1 Tax=Paenibacillus sp. J31TS4 TaxID=2807195 RepID=UPI001B0AFDC6|nr:HAMP domain-containing sensor histidine kinase [Paenibacillus sp. J31TS4]GIP37755.1 sporulation kinase [Paenibacillus sp. J31TS4]
MNQVKEVLLQLFFALMPFVTYGVYYRDRNTNYSRTFILLVSAVCLLLSMLFASSVRHGIIFDVRYVILFFGLVFGGLPTGLFLLLEVLLLRLYLGGPGTVSALLILAVTFPLSWYLSVLYARTRHKFAVTFLAGLSFSAIPILILYVMLPEYVVTNLAYHLFFLPVINTMGSWLLITLFHKSAADKELYLKYQQSEKLEAIGHVAASLVHEVRNPLTTVLGFLKLIRENRASPEKLDRFIGISIEEIQRTEQILSEYLSMSKPLTPHRKMLDFGSELLAVMDVMTPYATMHKVSLLSAPPHEPVPVAGNATEVKQMLVNFIKNAVEACVDSSKGWVRVSLQAEQGVARLSIEDNGRGMSPDQLKRLGSIYYSTKATGTGLGLTFSYKLIRSMNGSVSVRSTEHMGTEFTILLPLAEQEEQRQEENMR